MPKEGKPSPEDDKPSSEEDKPSPEEDNPSSEEVRKKPRVSRRVSWKQPGSTENPASNDTETPQRDLPENWGEGRPRTGSGANTSNDEQLRRDKPPHWG
jgi:5-methylcytosine-specific restriction endonuclease McrA